ncbi:MAG: protein-methionine-sulfoxide reductase catalytic subunit MsrP [Rhodospirillaceae bacterium]|nr:protein-methionine-sulfoxide reductase catalytic subunit MsrP [Rhodospirillaceae bacterium]
MLIKIKKSYDLSENDVTPEQLFRARRRFLNIGAASLSGAALSGIAGGIAGSILSAPARARAAGAPLATSKWSGSTDEAPTDFESITTYNNFYEFGTSKEAPRFNAEGFVTSPWTVEVAGLAKNTGTFDVWDLIDRNKLEERIYRHRCVETWSMVVPWVGVALADIIKRLEPQSSAKYVAFQTLFDPERMPGQKRAVLQWPYVEGLRLDEAMNPLALLAVGVYGQELPPQNGAPIRLVVPWKYGFKGIKSIVKIEFSENEPPTSWNISAPNEYGFYANVNPNVSHPRWSQAKERRIGEFLRRETLMFNGYADEVASLYSNMDLEKYF